MSSIAIANHINIIDNSNGNYTGNFDETIINHLLRHPEAVQHWYQFLNQFLLCDAVLTEVISLLL